MTSRPHLLQRPNLGEEECALAEALRQLRALRPRRSIEAGPPRGRLHGAKLAPADALHSLRPIGKVPATATAGAAAGLGPPRGGVPGRKGRCEETPSASYFGQSGGGVPVGARRSGARAAPVVRRRRAAANAVAARACAGRKASRLLSLVAWAQRAIIIAWARKAIRKGRYRAWAQRAAKGGAGPVFGLELPPPTAAAALPAGRRGGVPCSRSSEPRDRTRCGGRIDLSSLSE